MNVTFCEHLLYSELWLQRPQVVRTWLFLILKADKDGHVCIHRRVLPKIMTDITDDQCENALSVLQTISYHGEGKILRMEGDCNYFLESWTCRCIATRSIRNVSDEDREFVLAAGICANCGSNENLAVDHIFPISKGGSDELENLQCLCRSCNSRKSNRIEWKPENGRV